MTSAAPPDPSTRKPDPAEPEDKYLTLSEHLGELRSVAAHERRRRGQPRGHLDPGATQLPVGEYMITAAKLGYASATGNVTVSIPGDEYPIGLSMSERLGLTIKVVDSSGTEMSGATVNIRGPSPGTNNVSGSPVVTPTSGEVSFNSLADGTYALTASKTGYTTAVGSVWYDGLNDVVVMQLVVPMATTGDVIFTTYVRHSSSGSYHLDNCRLRVTGPNGYSRNIESNNSGAYTISDLPTGSYSVVPRSGWSGNAVSFTIGGGQTSYVTVYATGG